MIRATTASVRDTYVHFYVPPEIATNHSYTFVSRYSNESASTTTTNSFRILLNGVEKYHSPVQGLNMYDYFSFDVEKGGLLPGWNTLNPQFLDPTGYMSFDYLYFGISDYNLATFLLIR
jgi:hypothetical protein